MLVVTRYEVPTEELSEFLGEARVAIKAMSERPGFVRGKVGRCCDDAGVLLLSVEWVDVGSYRRALSSSDVKLAAVPLLSRAINEDTAFEILHSRGPEGVTDAPSSLAPDADVVRLGEASGPIPS